MAPSSFATIFIPAHKNHKRCDFRDQISQKSKNENDEHGELAATCFLLYTVVVISFDAHPICALIVNAEKLIPELFSVDGFARYRSHFN